MGVGQSTELCDSINPNEVFVHENKRVLAELLGTINDAAEFSERGKTDDVDLPRRRERKVTLAGEPVSDIENQQHGDGDYATYVSVHRQSSSINDDEHRRFTEEELAVFFSPYKDMFLSNYYIGDAGLLEPIELISVTNKKTMAAANGASEKVGNKNHSHGGTRVTGKVSENTSRNRSQLELRTGKDGPEIEEEAESAEPVFVPPLTILARNRYLTNLDLGYNHLTGAVIAPLVESICGLQHLRYFSLAGNPIGKQGCRVLGDWLATDPLLGSLSLFHCGLHDKDVALILDGLVCSSVHINISSSDDDDSGVVAGEADITIVSNEDEEDDEAAAVGGENMNRRGNEHLLQLNLDLNFCTAETLTRLVTLVETENSTLAVVWLEGSPHDPRTLHKIPTDRTKRIEYACTSEGHFRSGRTYYYHNELPSFSSQYATSWDQQSAVEQDAAATHTTAATERFHLRQKVLGTDFSGLYPLSPHLLARLETTLAPRRAAYVECLEAERAADVHLRSLEVIGDTRGARDRLNARNNPHGKNVGGENGEVDDEDVDEDNNTAVGTGDMTPTTNNETATGTYIPSGGACRGGDSSDPDTNGFEMKELGSCDGDDEGNLGDSSFQQQNQGGRDSPSASTMSRSGRRYNAGGGIPGGAMNASCRGTVSNYFPPLSSPERLQMVMTDALQFRALRQGTVDRVGEKVLQNGFDKVWMASVQESGIESKNVVVNDAPNYLRACWCDPRDAAVPYAGTLHYHCVREEAIDYGAPIHARASPPVSTKRQQQKKTATTTSSGPHPPSGEKRSNGSVRYGSEAKRHYGGATAGPFSGARTGSLDSTDLGLPLIGNRKVGAPSSGTAPTAEELVSQRKSAYKGCRGTGHRCASMKFDGATGTISKKNSAMFGGLKSGSGGAAAASASANSKLTACNDGVTYTNQSGVVMQLSYNPVVYFSSAYMPCADIVEDNVYHR